MMWQVILTTVLFADPIAPGAPLLPNTPRAPFQQNVPGVTPVSRPNTIERCLVSVIDDIKVPAQEAGLLTSIEVKEGDLVKKEIQLAQIDNRQATLQKAAATAEMNVAKLKAEDMVNEFYATAAFKVAEKELLMHEEANKVRAVTSKAEMNKLMLQVEQARLQIQKAQNERKIAGSEADAIQAKVDLADEQIRRRRICAPVDGEVVEIMARAGEWVEPGHPVFRVVGMQKLRVEGFANFADMAPAAIDKRAVIVRVNLSNNRVETFSGKIVFVNPVVLAGGMYRVWAEVENRLENNQFLLRPGVEAEMEVVAGAQAALPQVNR
jgi:multidrug efflux pump subunit AcrA (membrane-fusion protein)